jgi:hypothetical protein
MADPARQVPGDRSGRLQKRIAVGLTMQVRGKDARGVEFADTVHTTNISRTGASFSLHRDVEVGMDLEIEIPPRPGRQEDEFVMTARIVRAAPDLREGGWLLGVQFARRFHRVFVPETEP